MKTPNLCVLLLVFAFTGCATLKQPLKQIEFEKIEKLVHGQATSVQIKEIFGRPSGVRTTVTEEGHYEFWKYNGMWDDVEVQKASFTFRDGVVVGAVWLPYDSDAFHDPMALLTHYKNVKFEMKKEGWDKQGHSYSDDVHYRNPESGISFKVNASHNTVEVIDLWSPSSRNISSQL